MYAEYLRQLLGPTGLYELDEGAGAAELEAIGGQLDLVSLALDETEREGIPESAVGWGLERWEEILPIGSAAGGVGDRRAAAEALLRIDGTGFTLPAINDTLAGCGIAAVAEETDSSATVAVRFPGHRGVPLNFEAVSRGVESILPCHLAVEYVFVYATWAELETLLSWLAAETLCVSWDGVEKFEGEAVGNE